MEIKEEINNLKKQKNALILVHNYQSQEIYDIADFIGDSLELSKEAAQTDKDIIVFCGVKFMAETAKILNPQKKVLLPAINATCPMADMIKPKDIDKLRTDYPNAAIACYINTTADVKAKCDICITSANAANIINSLNEDEVVLVPDKNLAAYVSKNSTKKIISYEGYCCVHENMSSSDIDNFRKKFPDGKVIVHPECRIELQEKADYVASTSGMLKIAKQLPEKNVFIATEIGMIERLRKEIPLKTFHTPSNVVCNSMKLTSLELVRDTLLLEKNEVVVDQTIAKKARSCIEKMFEVRS